MSGISFHNTYVRTALITLLSIAAYAILFSLAHADNPSQGPYSAGGTPTTFVGLANIIASIFNAGAILLITATIAVYFYGVVSDIYNRGQGESANMGTNLLWGIAILFVMVSIWGIISYLQYSLFQGPPPAPTNGAITYPN